jgi:hypothetical protein
MFIEFFINITCTYNCYKIKNHIPQHTPSPNIHPGLGCMQQHPEMGDSGVLGAIHDHVLPAPNVILPELRRQPVLRALGYVSA